MRISPIYYSLHYKKHRARNKVAKPSKVKDVTEDYKKSLLTKKVVEVKSGPTQDPKLWQPQPKKICIGKRKGVKIMQYVAPFTSQQ